MKKLLLSLIFALVIGIIPSTAMAVEYGGVGGRPANPRADNPRTESIFIYELEPGESFKDAVEIFNNTEEERTISVGAVDSIAASDGAFSCAQEGSPKASVGSWITLSRTSVTVEAGDSEKVDFTITAPDDASVGEQSGCITIQDNNQQPTANQGSVVLTFRSAIRVAVTVPGDIVKAINVADITINRSPVNANVYTVRPTLINTGNVSLDTDVNVRLVSLFGVTIQETEGTYPVLPGTTASWNFNFDQPFWGGLYKADVIASYNSNVNDSVGENSGGEPMTATKSSSYVFIAPSPVAAAIELIGLMILLALIAIFVKRQLHKRTVAKSWTSYTVQEGDSLQKIAKSKHVSWKRLAQANKIKAPYHLDPGQKIKIPPHTKR